ncbi:MAG: hypothetical protein H8K11_01485 [Nitrospira sp.]|nr:hypothetical protein [Nitrospira sp.]
MSRKKDPIEKKAFGIRLDPALMKELQYLAVDKERWVNDLIDESIRDLLKKYREKKKP